MKISKAIDLEKSLRQLFGDDAKSIRQIEQDCGRQTATVNAILKRFFTNKPAKQRELTILADEVGLGKTYVALATAVSILDKTRSHKTPKGLPSNKPVVLVLTPSNDALFNKWMREAEAFKTDCARNDQSLEWLDIRCPLPGSSKSGNIVNLVCQMREASRKKPMLLIAKHSALGAALHDRDRWRRRGLAVVFKTFNILPTDRKWWCKNVLGTNAKTKVGELLDLRKSDSLWNNTDSVSPDLHEAFNRAIQCKDISKRIYQQVCNWNAPQLIDALDDLTRLALMGGIAKIPLLVIDEIHNLKNEHVQARRHLKGLLKNRVCRIIGLSAPPFQLRQDELLSLLKLRKVLSISPDRHKMLDIEVKKLKKALQDSRDSGDVFRHRWQTLRADDGVAIADSWQAVSVAKGDEQKQLVSQLRPPRIAHAIEAGLDLAECNQKLRKYLFPFVIRHQRQRSYRKYFVGEKADAKNHKGTSHFEWAPGIEVHGKNELAHYLMMRAVALAKDEKGLPCLGAELTGSYRHLVETAAVWKRMAQASNPLLREYRGVLETMIASPDADKDHRKVQTTVQRALEFFKQGQKTLIFCFHTKTAETIRDQVQSAICDFLNNLRQPVFGNETTFKNFRDRFFNRHEPLFSLIQDHPLLGRTQSGHCGVPHKLGLGEDELHQIAELLVNKGELANHKKPDRRLLLAATEQVAVQTWKKSSEGKEWIASNCSELDDWMAEPAWLEGREPLSRSPRAGKGGKKLDDEAKTTKHCLSKPDELKAWVHRLREGAIGVVIAPYFRKGIISKQPRQLPLLAQHHGKLLSQLDRETRAVAGQVFRRILMAEEFLLRYLADVERENSQRWVDFLSKRYTSRQNGHLETLRDRVHAYLETLVRAKNNQALLIGYRAAAENLNVVQLVKGDTQNRDRYFLGFNTPYRPEILVSTSVGQEGIDLHRECRHVIHHDLCWNPATIEQRTGRVDRIGSKVDRERLGAKDGEGPTLEIAVPYLAATYDERMFEELYRRAQLFEVTLGGDMRVENRTEPKHAKSKQRRIDRKENGTKDEELGHETDDTGAVNLPKNMVERLRVDLAVWKPPQNDQED